MRALRLARVAAQAELLRLQRFARRQAVRAVLGAIALTFLLACLAAVHVAGFFALRRAAVTPAFAALIVAGVDLLIAVIFGLLAARNTPDRVESEALQVRRTAQRELMTAAATAASVAAVLRVLRARGSRD